MYVTSSYIPPQTSPYAGASSANGTRSNPQADGAAGALASYMSENGMQHLRPKQLRQLAGNADGETPQGVQEAAKYMLNNPKVWQKIETNSDPISNGKASLRDLDAASEGKIALPASNTGATATTDDTEAETTQQAAGALADYMQADGHPQTMDPDELYQLAANSSGVVPADVQKAASYMLANPDVYRQIETADVPGADGVSGVGNFEQAAKGGIGGGQAAGPGASSYGGSPIVATGPGPVMQQAPAPGPDPAQTSEGGMPETTAPAPITASDPQSSMSALQQNDPVKFSAIMKDSQDGDGNKLVNDILDAYQAGDLSKDQATSLVRNAQYTANQHGGGKINGAAKTRTKDVLGENDLIKGGVPKWVHSLASFLGPVGSVINGATNAADGSTTDLTTAGKPAVQAGVSQAEQDLQALDPALARQLQAQIARHDGNGIAETLVQAKQEEGSGTTFSDADASAIASQDGVWGGGKTNAQADKDFTNAYGATVGDTMYNGLSGGEKFEKGLENIGTSVQGLVNSVIPFDKAGGVAGDAATGQWAAAGGQLLSGLETGAATALGAVSGGAGFALKGAEMLAKVVTTGVKEGESALQTGLRYASKGNGYANDVQGLTGPNNNNNDQPAYS